ncbi:MAG TPA: transcriptional regulator [Planctomycetota bacterium]|nr:transcriptional regulator [Planctomycetota bacterium]
MKHVSLARHKPSAAPAQLKARQRNDVVHLDPLIHERTRLGILTSLFTTAEPGLSFSDLRDTLSLTDGNLMAHLRTLEEAGIIQREKEGAGRNSSTTVQLSPSGRKAFANYLDQLEMLVRTARSK